MDKLRTAVVGCGKVGATHALAYHTLENAELCSVCDVSAANAGRLGTQYGVPAYNDFAKMLKEQRIDAVSVCTPHPLHADLIEQAAAAGVHVISEKPLAASLADCDRAIAACDSTGVKLSVLSQRRFYPPVVRMYQAIKAGKIGTPILGTTTVMGWRSPEYYEMDVWRGKWKEEGGGVMVNQTIHQLDLLQWLMGDVDELFGYWDNFNHPTIEVEDTAVAVIRFKSGAVGQFLVSNSQKPGFYGKVHIHGSNGASVGAQVEGGSAFISGVTAEVEPAYNDMWTVPGEEALLPGWVSDDKQYAREHDPMTWFHQLQIRDFLDAVLNDRKPAIDGREGRKAVELFIGVYRSQRDGKPVKFPLKAEDDDDFDGRLRFSQFSKKDRA